MKKVLSLLLAVMMVISLCPITALADEVNPIELQQVEAQETAKNEVSTQSEEAVASVTITDQDGNPLKFEKTKLTKWTSLENTFTDNIVEVTCPDIYIVTVPDEDTKIKINCTEKYPNTKILTDQSFNLLYETNRAYSFSDIKKDNPCFEIKDNFRNVFDDSLLKGVSDGDTLGFLAGVDDDGCYDNFYAEVGFIIKVGTEQSGGEQPEYSGDLDFKFKLKDGWEIVKSIPNGTDGAMADTYILRVPAAQWRIHISFAYRRQVKLLL